MSYKYQKESIFGYCTLVQYLQPLGAKRFPIPISFWQPTSA
jgi:hypothetical protein